MAERPIIFSGPMIRAILDGRKSQTRRVVQWPEWLDAETHGPLLQQNPQALADNAEDADRRLRCPYGVVGDQLWVRETWCPDANEALGPPGLDLQPQSAILYEADGAMLPPQGRWHPSIHLPRHLSRILLTVTEVRVERLRDISTNDALAEGLESPRGAVRTGIGEAVNEWFRPGGWAKDGADSARLVFADLWDSINARRGYGWEKNPWVWAISFRRRRNVSAQSAA